MGYKDRRDAQIAQLLEQGHSYEQVAKLVGKSVPAIKAAMRKKHPDVYEMKKKRRGRPRLSEEEMGRRRARAAAERGRVQARKEERQKRWAEVADYLFADDTRTLEEVGQHFGITRERVRQLAMKDRAPAYIARQKRIQRERAERQQAEHERLEQEHSDTYQCRVCGEPLELGRTAFCSTEHYEMWVSFRYHTDDGYRERHRRLVADWVLRHPEKVDDTQIKFSGRVLDPEAEIEERGRWFTQGSQNLERAIKMCEAGYPLFDELPEPLKQQVRRVIEAREVAEDGDAE